MTFNLLGEIDLVMVWASKGVSGLVAQLEERRLCEAEALGSNPSESMFDMHQAREVLAWEGLTMPTYTTSCEATYKLCNPDAY